jgi:hypothetical protein
MRINIGENWQRKLTELPEAGMGSQHVDIVLTDGRVLRDVPVFNGEDCEVTEPFNPNEIARIVLHQN